jgi:hypothetical protein
MGWKGRSMKGPLALAVLAALSASAAGKVAPLDPRSPGPVPEESAFSLGFTGSALESDYFRAPQPPAGARRIFPCRVRLPAFGREPRFAQACD